MSIPKSHFPKQVRFLGSFGEQLPEPGFPEVAFAGRSNVGKSSAINALLNRKSAARVSRTPGRTQHINLFDVDSEICFADLPGYGFAKVPEEVQLKWKASIEKYLGEREALCLVVVLVDSRRKAQELDRALIEGLHEAELPTIVVATKIDKLSKSKQKPQIRQLAAGLGIPRSDLLVFSSTKHMGIGAVWKRIRKACAQWKPSPSTPGA